jgi:predicted RNA-binding Zn-ribbon protein involved in translation (DUF1610 family)
MMKHTKECEQQFVERSAAIMTWINLWPNYCKTCSGAGASYSTYDPSPAGVSLSPGSMVDVEICPDCAEKGICSRCGEPVWDPDDIEYPCPKCGWDGKDCCPPESECICDFMDTPDILFNQWEGL